MLPNATVPVDSDFIHWFVPRAQLATKKTGIPTSWMIGQSCLETNFGRSNLAQHAHDLFAIRATGSPNAFWGGDRVTLSGNGDFREYSSYHNSIYDYCTLFYRVPAYAPALAYRADPLRFGQIITPIYAPAADHNQGYYQSVARIISGRQLTQYDVPPSEWALDPGLIGQQYVDSWKYSMGVA